MSDPRPEIRIHVIRPALYAVGMWTQALENLVHGTGFTESGYTTVDQSTPGPGPAYGWWQTEKPTHDDVWQSYINFQPSAVRVAMLGLASVKFAPPPIETLYWNMRYAAAMCALNYRRFSREDPLPEATDFEAMARYWKKHYNTPAGSGTVERATPFFRQVVDL